MYLISPFLPHTLSFSVLETGATGTLRAGHSLCDIEILLIHPVLAGCSELAEPWIVPDVFNGIYTNGREWYQIAFRQI